MQPPHATHKIRMQTQLTVQDSDVNTFHLQYVSFQSVDNIMHCTCL